MYSMHDFYGMVCMICMVLFGMVLYSDRHDAQNKRFKGVTKTIAWMMMMIRMYYTRTAMMMTRTI